MFLRDWRYITGLTLSDLRFEWILSLCMVLALGAVFSPLFILLGLREGIIGTLLDKLNSDPVSRLVTPKLPLQQTLDQAWLESLRQRAQVVIVSPVPRLLLDIEGVKEPVNTIPTAAKDPLLTGYGLTPPGEGLWVVLSHRLADITGKDAGDVLQITLVRSAPQEERVPIKLRVAGILPAKVSTDPKLWIPQDVFRWFNDWRRGLPAPELGLAGSGAGLTPEYDGIVTFLSRVPPDEDYRRMIAGKSSFSQLPQPVDQIGWERPENRQARLWMPVGSRVFEDDIVSLLNRHHELGYDADAAPYLDRFQVRLTVGEQQATLFLTVLPVELEVNPSDGHLADLPLVWIATGGTIGAEATGTISFTTGSGQEVKIPVRLVPTTALQDGFAAVPRALAGKMNAARRQGAIFDPATGELMPAGDGDRFFRAYAISIDALEGLVEWVQQRGVESGDVALYEPVSKVAEIRSVRQLRQYMETLYVLIVAVSGVSGFFAIAANVYAGVQRKRRDLAYLQLLGMQRGTLFMFPLLKSLVLVAGAVVVALIAYAVFAYSSGWLFAGLGTASGSLTRLGTHDILWLLSGIFGAAAAASLLAASAVTRIDPAVYIRE